MQKHFSAIFHSISFFGYNNIFFQSVFRGAPPGLKTQDSAARGSAQRPNLRAAGEAKNTVRTKQPAELHGSCHGDENGGEWVAGSIRALTDPLPSRPGWPPFEGGVMWSGQTKMGRSGKKVFSKPSSGQPHERGARAGPCPARRCLCGPAGLTSTFLKPHFAERLATR